MQATKARRAKKQFSPLLAFLIILLVALLGVGGYALWLYWGSNVVAGQAAAKGISDLQEVWAANPEPETAEDEPLAPTQPTSHEPAWILRIPKLGVETPIVAGIEAKDLSRGVGWYPESALPGQIGNFAIAGYRLTNGEPLRRVFELDVGDQIEVETNHARYTYELNSAPKDLTVKDDASWVLDPVPGQPDQVPSQALITITTAEDLVSSSDRAVGFGVLKNAEPK